MSDATWTRRGRRALPWLALAVVGLQFPGRLDLSTLALALWLAGLALVDRPVLRRLWMPRFLGITALIALASGLLIGEKDVSIQGIALSTAGLRAGALMTVRGILIFGITAWGSRALMRDEARGLRRWLHNDHLAAAIVTAVRLIPDLIERLRTAWDQDRGQGRLKRLGNLLVLIVHHAALTAERSASASPGALKVAIIGGMEQGKTATLTRLAQALGEADFPAGGILQPRFRQGEDLGYQLLDVDTGERRPFAHRRPPEERPPGYDFEPDGWTWAGTRIQKARNEKLVVVVDELGLLEARGRGHAPALLAPMSETCRLWLLGVRRDVAEQIEERLGPFDLVLDATTDDDEAAALLRPILERLEGME